MKKLLKSPILWGVLAALVVTIPPVKNYEFLWTDCTHVGVLSGRIDYPGMGPLTLYRFSDGNPQHMSALISAGLEPWFSTPDRKMNMCRHLSSAFTALNYQISGMNPLGYVLHSVLWYLVLIVLVGFLVRRIVPGSGGGSVHPVSFITVIIFALASRNAMNISYGGTRWLLITMAFGLAGLLAHIKWREQDWKPGRFLSLIAFLLALLSGEAALAMLAYLAAYELFGTSDPVKKRISALIPAAVMTFIYLVIYRLMNYGTANLGTYTNPFNDPIGFISALPLKVASMLGEMFLGVISVFEVNTADPSRALPTFLLGVGALVLVGLLFYPVWSSAPPQQRREFNWLMVGTAAAMLPFVSVQACSRVVLVLFIGGSILEVRNLDVPFKKGEILRFSGFQVTILEVNKDGPTRMEFTFERSLDDEGFCFYKLQEGRLHIVTLPAVGQSLTL